jgi:hypothetical protein
MDVSFCCVSGNTILSVSLVEASRIADPGYPFRGRSSMQALILCRRNIRDIRSNPEGYPGAYLAPRPCEILKLVRTPAVEFSLEKACIESVRLLRRRLTLD